MIKENVRLKEEIVELERRERMHMQTAKKMGEEIARLKKENEKLIFENLDDFKSGVKEGIKEGELKALKEIEEWAKRKWTTFSMESQRAFDEADKQLLLKIDEMRKAVEK